MTALQTPPGSWDSHMHIFDGCSTASVPSANYLPEKHSIQDADNLERSLGLGGIVLVQPSVYKENNSVLLQALQQWGQDKARGVVQFDPNTTTDVTLQDWHSQGVRAVRMNISSNKEQSSLNEIKASIKAYADRIRDLGWVLQMYLPLELLDDLEDLLPELDITVVLDHYGNPDFSNATVYRGPRPRSTTPTPNRSDSGYSSATCSPRSTSPAKAQPDVVDLDTASIPGLNTLVRLLQRMNAERPTLYIKVSGAYRLFPPASERSTLPDPNWVSEPALEAMTKLLLRQWISSSPTDSVEALLSSASSRSNLVFATDWPHTRYTSIEVRVFIERLKRWSLEVAGEVCAAQAEKAVSIVAQRMVDCLFRDTAERLWGVRRIIP